jgi:hypothetical protein
MRSRYAIRPRLEHLEERATPASVQVAAGNLIVRDPVGPLAVIHLGGGAFQVADNASNVVVGGVGTSVNIIGSNKADTVIFNANNPFGGRLLINTAGGNDTILALGTVGGNAVLLTGAGNDTIVANNLKVGGNLTVVDNSGKNSYSINGNNVVGGFFSARGFSEFNLNASKLTVGRDLVVSAPLVGPGLAFNAGPASELFVGKNWSVLGYSKADQVNVLGTVNVNGNTTLNLGGGNNSIEINTVGDSTLAGNFRVQSGFGDDIVVLDGLLTIGGIGSVFLGDGANLLSLGAFGAVEANGNWSINVGNGTGNTLVFDVGATFYGTVNLTVGNGDANLALFNTAPAGLLTFRGGNGSGNVLALNAGDVAINARFGNGLDPASNILDLSGGLATLTGVVQGSNFAGANLLSQGLAELLDIRLIGFPS